MNNAHNIRMCKQRIQLYTKLTSVNYTSSYPSFEDEAKSVFVIVASSLILKREIILNVRETFYSPTIIISILLSSSTFVPNLTKILAAPIMFAIFYSHGIHVNY